jgi:hypothetical protein
MANETALSSLNWKRRGTTSQWVVSRPGSASDLVLVRRNSDFFLSDFGLRTSDFTPLATEIVKMRTATLPIPTVDYSGLNEEA